MIFSLILFLSSLAASAMEIEYLNQVVLPHKMEFQKSKIGGLSGLHFDTNTQKLYAVSDDRGTINEPRIYEFKLQVTNKDFKVEPSKTIFLTVNESEFSHKTTQSSSKLFSRLLDLEAISMTPWGDFLLTNEGSMNKKPRVNPQLFSANTSGTLMREFEVPADFLPEPTGEQKKGVQNNMAFEGLTASPNGKEWMMSAEAALLQDPKDQVRMIRYEMPEAWVLKPTKEYRYPMPVAKSNPKALLEFPSGISEILYLNDHELLVLERSMDITVEGAFLKIQMFQTDLKQATPSGLLTKKMILDFSSLENKIGQIGNFEGMAWGPQLADGRRSLIVVSDDNFMSEQRTQFVLFAVKMNAK